MRGKEREIMSSARIASPVWPWLACVVLLGSAPRAAAQEPKQEYVEFKEAMVEALREFEAQNYPKARELFLQAYTIRPEPVILYDVAECFRNEGQPAEALAYYRRYLKTPAPDPVPRWDAEARADAERWVRELEQRLAGGAGGGDPRPTGGSLSSPAAGGDEASAVPAPPPTSEAGAPRSAEAARTESVSASGSHEAEGPPAVERERRPRRSPLRRWAWVSLAVGGAGLLGVIGFDQLARGAVEDKDRDPTPANIDRVERYELLVNTSLVVAAIGVTAGVTLYVLSRPRKRRPSETTALRFGVIPTPGGAAALLDLHF
jgi:hypothetical protein